MAKPQVAAALSLSSDQLTRSVEDYLKAIWTLSADGASASTSEIAAHLALSAPSVSGMVKRLCAQGLLSHEPYRGVTLTDDGRRAALRMVRRHRILEAYLVERLGYTWDMVHVEAERLEHAVSDALVARMAEALGNPRVDPHGDPIPDADLVLVEEAYVALADVEVGETVVVRRVVGDEETERLRYLATLGLVPGSVVTVIDRQPFDGPIVLRTGGATEAIGRALGRVVLCVRDGAAS